jgi:hypothetical protein
MVLDSRLPFHDRHERPKPAVAARGAAGSAAHDQPNLDLASAGVQRFVWHSAYGAMLIEVRDGAAFVNGARVAPMVALRDAQA